MDKVSLTHKEINWYEHGRGKPYIKYMLHPVLYFRMPGIEENMHTMLSIEAQLKLCR